MGQHPSGDSGLRVVRRGDVAVVPMLMPGEIDRGASAAVTVDERDVALAARSRRKDYIVLGERAVALLECPPRL
jgi:hypothetical protein